MANIIGTPDPETIDGTEDADVINGQDGDDTLNGFGGNDILIGGTGADVLNGGAGFDTADYSTSGFGLLIHLQDPSQSTNDALNDSYNSIERILGSTRDDDFVSIGSGLVLDGGDGDDRFTITIGGEALHGGDGTDTVTYTRITNGVVADLSNLIPSAGDAAGNTFTSIENLIGTVNGNDTLAGNDAGNLIEGQGGDDTLDGRQGNDTLLGGNGDDTINGGSGADTLDGGSGTDTVSYATAQDRVEVRLWNQTATGSQAIGDTISGFENAIGGFGNDALIGSFDEDNQLEGGDGNDYLDGLSGHDILMGGDGNDRLIGGAGIDLMLGGDGDDEIHFDDDTRTENGVAIDLGGVGRDTLVMVAGNAFVTNGLSVYGFEVFRGADGDDRVRGNLSSVDYDMDGGAGNDRLIGLGGDDILIGGSGNDYIAGAGGMNTLEGGEGIDTVSFETAGNRVEVRLWNQTVTGSQANGDTISGFENAITGQSDGAVIGSDLANVLTANAGNDYLDGLGGNDTLIGGTGDDRYVGGTGSDIFVFESGADTILDFTGGDRIDISAFPAITSFADLSAIHTQDGSDSLFDFGSGNTLRVVGKQLSDFTGRDFGISGFEASYELSSLDGSNGFVINGIDAGDQSGRSPRRAMSMAMALMI